MAKMKTLQLTDLFVSSGRWASLFPFQSSRFIQFTPPPPCEPPPCENKDTEQDDQRRLSGFRLTTTARVQTLFRESFLAFLTSSLRGCSGIVGGGGDTCWMKELLRSLPPEWVEDSDVVRERRPDAYRAVTLVRLWCWMETFSHMLYGVKKIYFPLLLLLLLLYKRTHWVVLAHVLNLVGHIQHILTIWWVSYDVSWAGVAGVKG